ncbi:MAG: hypothetical protein HY594_05365 [Candidatus Omnitrophica bacterium]|nr:hypothetical protein [Candidatus Omnitrophota bacterium]
MSRRPSIKPWVLLAIAAGLLWSGDPSAYAAEEAAPITFRVVAVNPSATKTQRAPIKYYLPQEIGPKDILDAGGLEMDYDDQKGSHYVHGAPELKPRETRVFEVIVNDVWTISKNQLSKLRDHTNMLLGRLEKTTYQDTANALASSIFERLDKILSTQEDETLGRKEHIAAFRYNGQSLEAVKEDIAKLEKLMTFTGGPPIPEMLEESRLKSDAPSTKTTWMLIILIVIFIGFIGGLFFITWQKRMQSGQEISSISQITYPPQEQPPLPGSGTPSSDQKKGKVA